MNSVLVASVTALIAVWFILQAVAWGWLGLSLRSEVRPLEAVALVVNLLIAFFLQRFFATQINDMRAEKNVLIDATREIIRLLNEVRERTEGKIHEGPIQDEDKEAIVTGLRRIANAITELEEGVEMSRLGSIKECIPGIKSNFYTLKIVLTGDAFPAKGFTIRQRNFQLQLFKSIATDCRRMIFKVNSANK